VLSLATTTFTATAVDWPSQFHVVNVLWCEETAKKTTDSRNSPQLQTDCNGPFTLTVKWSNVDTHTQWERRHCFQWVLSQQTLRTLTRPCRYAQVHTVWTALNSV